MYKGTKEKGPLTTETQDMVHQLIYKSIWEISIFKKEHTHKIKNTKEDKVDPHLHKKLNQELKQDCYFETSVCHLLGQPTFQIKLDSLLRHPSLRFTGLSGGEQSEPGLSNKRNLKALIDV